jgi:surface carbohydrate biosynthesis protein
MIKNILKKFKKLFKIKFRFDFPKSKKILLFDEIHSSILKEIIKKDFNILKARDELEIYFWIFFKQIIFFDFRFNTYCKNYIKFTSPKIVITFNDNYIQFYKFKKELKNVKFISIQNGVRLANWFHQIRLLKTKNLECDHIFVFNKYIEKKYKKNIKSKFHILGSFKNNIVKINNTENYNTFLFISQFDKYNKKNQNFQLKVLNLIKQHLSKSNTKLHILLRGKNYLKLNEEIDYFKKIFHSSCVFHKTSKWKNIYKILDKFENIIFMFSSLGYEAISRKKKVIIFSPNKHNNYNYHFGWPAPLKKNQNFFSIKKMTYKETKRVMNNVYNCNQINWEKKYYRHIKDQLYLNKDNIRLKKVILSLL